MRDVLMNPATHITPWQLFLLGGPMMWPILLCSILALAITIEKFFYYASINGDMSLLKERIFDAVKKNDIKSAVVLCEKEGSPVANVLKAGLLKFGGSKDEITRAMEDASQFEMPFLEKRLAVLSAVGNVAPMLGLLGTVLGMCIAFHTIQVRAIAMNPVTPGDIAGGMWQALITTVAGLMVMIPSTTAYHYFVSSANKYALQMEKVATDLADLIASFSTTPHHERD